MRRLLLTSAMVFACICAMAQMQRVDTVAVRLSVERMLGCYPHSTLQDIYKSFFQDRFGPGHIVPDSAQAAAYLRRELEAVECTGASVYEPTGEQGNYYRVALAVIADGRVPFDSYLSAFLRSVRDVAPVDVAAWEAEWAAIEGFIASMGLGLPRYSEDAAAIRAMLSQGQYAVHHSRTYNEHYAPHYRIIAKEIFVQEILPLLGGKSKD